MDTSFWVHAGMVRAHPELLSEYDLTVPGAVAAELGIEAASPSSLSAQAMKVALQHGTARILDPVAPLISEFHAGERAVLTLALERPDAVIPLIDEARAYHWAVKKGLPVLSVPLWLATRALRGQDEVMETIAKIKALVLGRHVSMLLAHEPLSLLAVESARTERSG